MRKGIASTMSVLGIAVGVLSIASLIERWGDITLADVTARILGYYRGFSLYVKHFALDWWTVKFWPDLEVPAWTVDVLLVWLISIAAYERSFIAMNALLRQTDELVKMLHAHGRTVAINGEEAHGVSRGRRRLAVRARSTALAPLFATRLFFTSLYGAVMGSARMRRHYLSTAGLIIAPFVGAAAFFAWNAIQLSFV